MSRKKHRTKVKRYTTGLNDKKWEIISPLLPGALPRGRPRKISLRRLVNAIVYVVRSGCAWRLPPWVSALTGMKGFDTRTGHWCGKANPRSETSHSGRYTWFNSGRRGNGCISAGAGRRKTDFQRIHRQLQKTPTHLG
jgi:transposase